MRGALGEAGAPGVRSSWASVRVWLHLERGLRVVSFEVLPLRTESMGNSTAHLSCPNLILRPGCQFGVRGRFGRDGLAMGQSPPNLSLSEQDRVMTGRGRRGEDAGRGAQIVRVRRKRKRD